MQDVVVGKQQRQEATDITPIRSTAARFRAGVTQAFQQEYSHGSE